MPPIPVAAPALGGVLKVLGGIAGLFGKKKAPSPWDNIMSQVGGARDAERTYGVNFLTALQHGQPGGSMATGEAPPLASLGILADIFNEEFGQDAKDRREHNQLGNDLLKLEIEQARGSMYMPPPPSAVAGLSDRTSALGGNAPATYLTEADRNPAVADERDNTVSYQSHGQQSVVPVGPDLDEVITGALIEANNRSKARREMEKRQDVGTPLALPSAFPWSSAPITAVMPPFQSSEQFWDDFFKKQKRRKQ